MLNASSTDYSTVDTTLKRMQTCINVLGRIYASAYFDLGLLMKALEITSAKPMYMRCIFLCKCGMHFFMAGFASTEYHHGKAGLRKLSFESDVSVVGRNLSGKKCDLSCGCYHYLLSLTMLWIVLQWVIVVFPGHTNLHFLFSS